MLKDFNEGRSKIYYCIAATILELEELQEALTRAKRESDGLDIKNKSKNLHSILDVIALKKNYFFKIEEMSNGNFLITSNEQSIISIEFFYAITVSIKILF